MRGFTKPKHQGNILVAATLSPSSSSSSSSSFFFFFFFFFFLSSHATAPVPPAAPLIAAADVAVAVDADSGSSCHPSDLAALRSIAAAFPAPLFNYADYQHNHGGGGAGGHINDNTTRRSFCCGRWSKWTCVACNGGRVTGLEVIVPLAQDQSQKVIPRSTPFPSALCTGLPALTSLVMRGPYLLSGSFPLCAITGHNLTQLQHLVLSGNGLTGPLPPLLPFPPSLQFLSLRQNQITGPIPAASQASFPPSLRHLDLSDNLLKGSIPGHSLPHSLQFLDLSANQFTGSIAPSVSLLQSLRYLSLAYNSLSGEFPSSLANASSFPHLKRLYLHANYALCGPLPSFNTPNLASLVISSNAFFGPPPTFNTPALQYLDLSSNRLSGSLSPLFRYSNLTSLQELRLSGNYFLGMIQEFHPYQYFSDLRWLDLSFNVLRGEPPNSICRLSKLSHLDLSGNSFTGQFNTLQCNATQLQQVLISHNNFSGPFPDWLGSHRSLDTLSLDYNHFSGSLPSSWRNLTSLSALALSGNSIIDPDDYNSRHEPKLPKWLFNISSVYLSSLNLQPKDLLFCSDDNDVVSPHTLDVSNNLITAIDQLSCFSHGNLTGNGLRMLNLSGNPLMLHLNDPNAVKLPPLQMSEGVLDLSSCLLTGHLTSFFFDRLEPSFSELYLAHNQLEGQIPEGLGNMSRLRSLDLSHNSFTGFTPLMGSGFVGLDLSLSNNDLSGDLFSMLSNMAANISCEGCIVGLDLSRNRLTGAIPPFLGRCLSLSSTRLKLNHNLLESFIPNELFPTQSETQLQIFSLGNNMLSGLIPASFVNLRHLVLLDLSHNRLEGNLESASLFSNTSRLQYACLRVLDLGYNRFSGTIPTSLGELAPALQVIDLSNNYLTGSIPSYVLESLPQFRIQYQLQGIDINKGSLYEDLDITIKDAQQHYEYVIEALVSLDLSCNNLSGEISNIGLAQLSALVYLNLSRNSFSGPLPSELGELGSQLQSMDLSFNKLRGPIPPSFQNLSKLAVFNVSYNEGLVGPIPQNSPQLENEMSYIGDHGLCGQLVHRACNTPKTQKTIAETTFNWFDEWISISGLCLGFFIGFLGFLYVLQAFYIL